MKNLHAVMFCCFSVAFVRTSSVLELSSYVGGEVSIHCSVGRTKDSRSEHSSLYFCKGVCSRENILIQTEGKRSAVTQQGRYSMEVSREDEVFNVTIKELERADAGSYCCGAEKNFNVLYQDVSLMVLDASTVAPGSPPSITAVQTEAETLSWGGSHSSTPSSTEKTNQQATINLSDAHQSVSPADTTVVIIVSVSLAPLVCALIPLIFYRHWRSNTEDQSPLEANKGEADYGDGNGDGASTQETVRLQTLEPDPEGASNYASIYQGLDPKSLD